MATINVVETLSVNIPIGSKSMNKHVTNIYPTKRRPEPLRLGAIAIFSTGRSDKLAIAEAWSQKKEEDRDGANICGSEMNYTVILKVSKHTSIKPHSVQRVLVVSTGRGRMHFEHD